MECRKNLSACCRITLIAGLLACVFIASSAGAASNNDSGIWSDKAMIRVGSYYVDQATTDFTVLNSSGAGGGVSFTDTLGGERRTTIPRLDIYYRFNESHRIDFSSFSIDRDGRVVLDGDLEIGDETFLVNETVVSSIKYDVVNLAYSYSFYHSPQVELAFTVGLDTTDFDISYRLEGGGKTGAQGASAPLPLWGLRLVYRINKKWTIKYVTETFYIEIEDTFKGSLINNELDIEYKVLDQFALGAGLTRVGSDLKVKDSDWKGSINDSHRGFLLYGAYYF
jgi:hypothetical protein